MLPKPNHLGFGWVSLRVRFVQEKNQPKLFRSDQVDSGHRVIQIHEHPTPTLLWSLFFFSFPFTLYSLFISMFACNINLLLLIHHQQQLKFNWHGSSICLILGWNLRFNCHNRILKSMSLANRKKRKEKCALNEIALDCPSKRTEKMRSYQPRMFGRFVRHYIMIIRGRCPTK